jgi:hypothetical protein
METNLSPSSTRRRHWPTAEHPEVRVVTGLRQRTLGLLDWTVEDPPADPSLEEVVAAARPFTHADGWMLAGGEPTLRADFPRLVQALVAAGAPRLGMITDGLALAGAGGAKVVELLRGLGLARVRVRLQGSRHDAHDWLVDQKGSWRRAVKAVQVAVDGGLEVEIEHTITRPTAPFLEESVELFARLGAKAVVLRRITARGPAGANDVAVAARFGLIQQELETAVQVGVRRGLRVMMEGFPQCAAPGAAAWQLATDAVVWAVPEGGAWPFLRPALELPASGPGCARCPGAPACCQAPLDYTRRFGRLELDSEGNRLFNPGALPPTPLQGGDTPPPDRHGRTPPTRLSYVRAAARLPSLGGDPLALIQPGAMGDTLRVVFVAPSRVPDPVLGDARPAAPESTRDVRIRLVRVAQHGARTIRVASAGSLAHPDAAELLREATRLEIERIEVAGEASALADFGDMAMRRLRGVTRVDAALFGPDAASHEAILQRPGAFEGTLQALDRLATLVPNITVGVYAVLSRPEELLTWAELWDRGELPGEPWFRLSPRGGDLAALAREAERLSPGPARDAIAAVLPRALFARGAVTPAPEAQVAWGEVPTLFAKPSGSDRFGCYADRPSRGGGPQPGEDPGYAVGWMVEGRLIPDPAGA